MWSEPPEGSKDDRVMEATIKAQESFPVRTPYETVLRDELAKTMLRGMGAELVAGGWSEKNIQNACKRIYMVADCMMEARK